MPRRAAIRINRNNKKIRLTIDLILLTRDVARFLSDLQCLKERKRIMSWNHGFFSKRKEVRWVRFSVAFCKRACENKNHLWLNRKHSWSTRQVWRVFWPKFNRFSFFFFKLSLRSSQTNRPLPSSKNPHFQNEARCTTFLMKMSLFAWEWKMISISKAEQLPSFWNRGPGELGNGLLEKHKNNHWLKTLKEG